MKLAVCFCVHSGELEIKAMMLAASLRRHWPASVELIGCIPTDVDFGYLSDDCRHTLDSLGVRPAPVVNPFGTEYPIGNKLPCLDAETEADQILFLDSDIMALVPASGHDLAAVFDHGFAAKPADLATFRADLITWQSIYRACGAEMPEFTVTATTSGEAMAPYFNAGVIATRANTGFGRIWVDCARVIDGLPDIPAKRPHLDQIALPVAVAKSGHDASLLDEEWNFPAHLRPLPQALPRLCHYHWPKVIEREPALLDAVRSLVSDAPSIAEVMERTDSWHGVAHKVRGRKARFRSRALPEGLITGIPRSGTSYLCRLLHELRDHVVINEPAEIFVPLNQPAPGHGVASYYRDLRRRILDGEAVENKTEGGSIIADTAKMDVRTAAPVAVEAEDFMLWTKNTLAYMNRLPQLLEAMPEATFVACVRHPVDTIASWGRTFPHLRDADVERFPVGHPADPLISHEQREQLADIARCIDVHRRRAMLWNYLAGIILRHRDRLIIIRLEDCAASPDETLRQVATASRQRSDRNFPSRSAGTEPAPDICSDVWQDAATAFGYA